MQRFFARSSCLAVLSMMSACIVDASRPPERPRQAYTEPAATEVSSGTRRAAPPSPRGEPAPEPKIAFGTCFAISKDGFVLTARHVVAGARDIEVAMLGSEFAAARIVSASKKHDLALLATERATPKYLTLAPRDSLSVGQRVFTMGFPVVDWLGLEPKFTDGSISAIRGPSGRASLMQVTVPIQPGNSGGPLVDEQGRAVGVITSTAAAQEFFKATGALPQGINFAVRADAGKVWPANLREQPDGPARERSEAIQHVRSTLCAVRAGNGTLDPSVPVAVAGFRLGIPAKSIKASCWRAGQTWSAQSSGQGRCSGAIEGIGVPTVATVRFCDGKACLVRLRVAVQEEKLVPTFNKLSSVLENKYGAYTEKKKEAPFCGLNGLEACVRAGHARWKRSWSWPDGHAIQLILEKDTSGADGAVLHLTYASSELKEEKERERRKKKRKLKKPKSKGGINEDRL